MGNCLIDQAADIPSIIFFIISYRLRALKTFFLLIYKKKEKKNVAIFAKNFARNSEQKKIICTWNIRRLVDESLVPATQRPSLLTDL